MTTTALRTSGPDKYVLVEWAALATEEIGDSARMGQRSDKAVQVSGTFAAESVTLQGSMDGTAWVALTDYAGDPLTFTVAGMRQIAENPLFIRPLETGGGDGTTSLKIVIGGRLE